MLSFIRRYYSSLKPNNSLHSLFHSLLYISAWKFILKQCPRAWVVFSHGSVVILPPKSPAPSEDAIKFIAENGPIHPACQHGYFNIRTVKDYRGWIVSSHQMYLATYVPPEEIIDKQGVKGELEIVLHGRSKRHKDSQQKEIIHIEKQSQEDKYD